MGDCIRQMIISQVLIIRIFLSIPRKYNILSIVVDRWTAISW